MPIPILIRAREEKVKNGTRIQLVNSYLQVFGIREKLVKYHCCDCKRKLKARAKTPEWRKIPADQKRCRSCSARHRGLLKWQQQQHISG